MRKISENFGKINVAGEVSKQTVSKSVNIGNSFGLTPSSQLTQGVMNHYTPIDNIVINVRNLFGALYGLVVSKGEDGVSLKIKSTNFTTPQATQEMLQTLTFDGFTYLYNYIVNQGLRAMKIVDLGTTCVAYFCPDDLGNVTVGCSPCEELKAAGITEGEMFGPKQTDHINEDNEVELEDHTKEELAEIINDTNKVKAANDFANKISSEIVLPTNMYIKATKDAEGNESISLRYKTTKRRPFGGKVDVITSLMNIYKTGPAGVWVDAFLNPDMYDEDTINIINNILAFIGAEKTSDEAVWNIPEGGTEETNVSDADEETGGDGFGITQPSETLDNTDKEQN